MSRPVCRYWQQGNCKFGSNCRFEHPNRNQNSFSALSGGGSNRSGGAKFLGELPYRLDKDVIQKDLTEDKPIWILSAYSPGKDAPEQLFGGYPREQSFEEIRLHYEMAAAAGNPQGALNEIEALYNNAQQQHQQVLSNIDAAIDFIIAAENKHPNRIDICKSSAPAGGTTGAFSGSSQANAFSSAQTSSPFQTGTAPTTGAFGQTSALGQKPNPFGGGGGGTTSAFGQPSQLGGGTTSAFGQPSQLGGGTTSAFGKPSQLGGGSAFGQSSAMNQNSAFGQTSALGQKPNPFGGSGGGTSAFGQPSSLGQNSAFGQPAQPATSSAFGQPAQASSGFGQPSALGQKPNPFGATSAATASPSPFASAANASAAPAANPFLQKPATSSPSPFAQQAATPPANPFGQPQPQASGFGAPTQTQDNAMDLNTAPPATASPGFGATTTTPAPANPFAQVQSQGQAPSGFGQPAANSNSTGFGFGGGQQATNNAARAPSAAKSENPYAPDASRQHPPLSSYATKGPDGRLQSWKGKPVAYKMIDERPTPGLQGFDGTFQRIWFPDGPPAYYRDTEPASAGMTYTNKEKAAWDEFTSSGRFKLGSMPEMPPLREFCSWDI